MACYSVQQKFIFLLFILTWERLQMSILNRFHFSFNKERQSGCCQYRKTYFLLSAITYSAYINNAAMIACKIPIVFPSSFPCPWMLMFSLSISDLTFYKIPYWHSVLTFYVMIIILAWVYFCWLPVTSLHILKYVWLLDIWDFR